MDLILSSHSIFIPIHGSQVYLDCMSPSALLQHLALAIENPGGQGAGGLLKRQLVCCVSCRCTSWMA